jgi:hypothetical protein
MVITKGDLFDQERKLIQSGLADHFAHVEIVSDKTPDTYRRIFDRHGQGTARAAMIGNSLKSDILPALEAGSWAVHVSARPDLGAGARRGIPSGYLSSRAALSEKEKAIAPITSSFSVGAIGCPPREGPSAIRNVDFYPSKRPYSPGTSASLRPSIASGPGNPGMPA